jgi:acetyl esterase/lipase
MLNRYCWFVILILAAAPVRGAEPAKVLELWPGTPPGEVGQLPPEADLTRPTDGLVAGKPVIRLGNVSKPTIAIYRPAPGKNTGVAVLVCPGGAYRILAMDLEGTEVCDWLNSLGITGVLLKYRVPERSPLHRAPLQDAQRALGLVRFHAREWGLDPKRIGIMGFSAGGHLAAALSNNYRERVYPRIDAADGVSCRPDFTLLIYPAYLTLGDRLATVGPGVTPTPDTPPTFIVMAEDDPVHVENALVYAEALRRAKVPLEMHIYATGGHGYGLRRTRQAITTWPERAAAWLARVAAPSAQPRTSKTSP